MTFAVALRNLSTKNLFMKFNLILGLLIIPLSCGKKDNARNFQNADDFVVEIPFKALRGADISGTDISGNDKVGSEVKCGGNFNLGSDETSVTLKDFRYYVSKIKFIKVDGSKVDFKLDQDGKWQGGDVALLDYANLEGACASSSSPDGETRQIVRGLIKKDQYVGIEFQLGLDDTTNHLDATTARPPLNIPGLWWSWKGGYKEIRLELSMNDLGKDYLFHHGATSCSGSSSQTFQCTHENNAVVSLTGDPLNSAVVFNIDHLFSGESLESELVQNKTKGTLDIVPNPSSYGCMAFPNDGDCEQLFSNLNLVFKDSLAGITPNQNVFSLKQGPSNVREIDGAQLTVDNSNCSEVKKVSIGDPCFNRSNSLDVDLEVGDTSHPSGQSGFSSHNSGTQCVQCHQAHGPGKGRHMFSGTVYAKDMITPIPGAKVEIFNIPKPTTGSDTRTAVKTFFTDKSGNFYTTTDYLSSLITNTNKEYWVRVSAGDGSGVKYMNSSKVSGQCSQCHIGGQRIYIDK